MFLNKCGLQSIECISCFWAPHFCASLASGHVFVTDLAGIRVLSPSGRADISRSVSCVSKETKVSKNWCFCLGTMCFLYLSVCREGQICSAGSSAGCAGAADPECPAAPPARGTSSNLKLSSPTVQASPLISEQACKLSKVNQSLYFRLAS